MSAPSASDRRKMHVNLTLRADLYGLAQDHAKAEGMSVSAFFERMLLAMTVETSRPHPAVDLDPEFASLRGIIKGSLAGLSKEGVRAIRHEARISKAGR